jgi:hypothetical protein
VEGNELGTQNFSHGICAQMHLETLHRNSLQLHNVITRDITVLHGTIEIGSPLSKIVIPLLFF